MALTIDNYGATDVSVFGLRWLNGITPVGVVLRAANQNKLIAGGNHTFIYRQPAARHVATITCADEWNHAM